MIDICVRLMVKTNSEEESSESCENFCKKKYSCPCGRNYSQLILHTSHSTILAYFPLNQDTRIELLPFTHALEKKNLQSLSMPVYHYKLITHRKSYMPYQCYKVYVNFVHILFRFYVINITIVVNLQLDQVQLQILLQTCWWNFKFTFKIKFNLENFTFSFNLKMLNLL